jgi:hypothetical protein
VHDRTVPAGSGRGGDRRISTVIKLCRQRDDAEQPFNPITVLPLKLRESPGREEIPVEHDLLFQEPPYGLRSVRENRYRVGGALWLLSSKAGREGAKKSNEDH